MNTLENIDTTTTAAAAVSTTNLDNPAHGTGEPAAIVAEPGEQDHEQEQDHAQDRNQVQQQMREVEVTTAHQPRLLPAPAIADTEGEQDQNPAQDQQQVQQQAHQANAPAAQSSSLLPVPATVDPAKEKQRIVLNSGAVKVHALSDTEFFMLCSCEEEISNGWETFVKVGEALACIRDHRLYRDNFLNFQDYCQVTWEYGRRYVDFLISAAQLVKCLGTNSSQPKPERETQVRPLVGLPLDQAKLAWAKAVEMACGQNITAHLVKRAMRQLHLKKITDAAPRPIRVNKAKQRETIDQSFGELLVLVSQKAGYDLITQKIEALHTHVHALFAQARPARASA